MPKKYDIYKVINSEKWPKLVECNALLIALHLEKCNALQKNALLLLQKM